MSLNQQNQQLVRSVRENASKLAQSMGVDDFEIAVEDIRFLVLCRSIGFGDIEQLSIQHGRPSVAKRCVERYDFKRDLRVSE